MDNKYAFLLPYDYNFSISTDTFDASLIYLVKISIFRITTFIF